MRDDERSPNDLLMGAAGKSLSSFVIKLRIPASPLLGDHMWLKKE